MEWSKEKTMKLIELLQVNPTLWNPSQCDTRRDKQKRKEHLRSISELLGASIADVTKKVQHLRTQYNRESVREVRANDMNPHEKYISNWYAFDYLHFLKDTTKPFRLLVGLVDDKNVDNCSINNITESDRKQNLSPPLKLPRLEDVKPDVSARDEFTVFGEYIANELRTLKGEKNLLVAKKKLQDVIFEVKMNMISESRLNQNTCTVYANINGNSQSNAPNHGKMYSSPTMNNAPHIEPMASAHSPPTSAISEIIINSACHYSNFKVDNQ